MTSLILSSAPSRFLACLPSGLVAASGLATASAINLAALLLWVRWLGPAAFGTLTMLAAAGLLTNALAYEWLRLAGARLLIVNGEVAPAILADWVRASGLTTLVMILLALLAVAFGVAPVGLPATSSIAVALLAVSEMAIAAVCLVERLHLRPWRFATLLVGRALLLLAGGALALANGAGVPGVIAVMIAAPLTIALIVAATDPLWCRAFSLRPAGVRDLVKVGALLVPASILQLAASLADRLLAGALLGSAAAGALAAPADLVARTLGFAMMALNLTAYPMLVRLYDGNDPAAAERALRRNGLTLLGVSIPLTALLILLATPLTSLLLGPAYATAASLLPWLAAATLLRLIGAFHFGVRFQLERRMTLLLPGPAFALFIMLCGARPAISATGLLGLVQLGCAAQAAGLAVSAMLARTPSTPRTP